MARRAHYFATLGLLIAALTPLPIHAASPAREAPSWDAASFHMDIGADFGQAIGAHVHPEALVQTGRIGEFGFGALISVHGHFWYDPQHVPAGLEFSGTEATIRLAPSLGHVLLVPGRAVGFGLHVHAGLLLLDQHMKIVDAGHDLELGKDHTEPYFEAGATLSLRLRPTAHTGLTVELTLPLLLSNPPSFPDRWLIEGPTVNVAFALYL